MTRRRKVYLLLAFIVFAVIAVNAYVMLRAYLSQENIRRRIIAIAQEQLGCKVEIGRAEANVTGLLELADLRLYLPGEELGEPAVACDRLLIDCTLPRLLSGKGGIDEIEITKPIVRLNPKLLDFLSKLSKPQAEVQGQLIPQKASLHGGVLWFDAGMLYTGSQRIKLSEVELTVQADSYSATRLEFRGSATQLTAGAMNISGKVDLAAKALSLDADVPRIEITRAFRSLLPANIQQPWDDVNLTGNVGISLKVAYSWAERKLIKQELAATLIDCAVKLKDFPLHVTQINGQVESDGKGLIIHRAIGRHDDGTVEVSRGYIGAKTVEIELVGHNVPVDQQIKDALPPDVRAVWKDFDVFRGEADVTYRLIVQKDDGKVRPEHCLDLQMRGVSANFKDVPYPVSRIAGRLHVQTQKIGSPKAGFVEVDIQGIAGTGTVAVKGRVPLFARPGWCDAPAEENGYEEDGMRTDMAIVVRGITIDYQAKQALPPDVLDVIQTFDPSGTVDIDATLKLSNNGGVRLESKSIITDLNGITVKAEFFPGPVQKVTGEVEWNGDTVKLVNVHGFAGKAAADVNGEIDLKKPPGDKYNLDVNVRDIDAEEATLKCLPPEVANVLRDLNAEGTVDVNAKLRLELGQQKGSKVNVVPVSVSADLRNVSARIKQFPYPVNNVSGRVEWKNDIVKLIGLRGFCDECVVDVVGGIDLKKTPDGLAPQDVVVNVRGLQLDDRLRRALDKPTQAIWDSLQPWGKINVLCVLRFSSTPNEVIRKLVIDLDQCEATYAGFPYRMKNLTGQVVFEDSIASIENVAGRSSVGQVRLMGRLWLGDSTDDEAFLEAEMDQLFIQARGIPFDGYLKDAMPPDWVAIWNKVSPEGSFDTDLYLSWLPGSSIWVDDGSTFTTHGITLTGYRMPDMTFPVRMNDDYLTVKEFYGAFYGGQASGNLRIERNSDKFAGKLRLSNIDLKQFRDDRQWVRDVRGLLSARIELSGSTSDKNSLEGKAEVEVRNGQLANLPVLAGVVMPVISLSWAGGNAITDAEVGCSVKEGVATFGRGTTEDERAILLSGPSVPVTGDGTITLDGDMDLLFVTSNESKEGLLSKVPLVGPLYDLVDQNLISPLWGSMVQMKVTGNVKDEKPTVTVQAFDPLVKPFKAFAKFVFGGTEKQKKSPGLCKRMFGWLFGSSKEPETPEVAK